VLNHSDLHCHPRYLGFGLSGSWADDRVQHFIADCGSVIDHREGAVRVVSARILEYQTGRWSRHF
jgi:hypothetical protein